MIDKVMMFGATNVGLVRATNQDSFLVQEDKAIGILADGIGGRKGGKTASSMAVDFLGEQVKTLDSVLNISSFLLSNIDKVNSTIFELGLGNEKLNGMGTTLELMVLRKNRIYIGHLGDSRTYLYYKKHFWLLTIDHNIRTFLARKLIKRENLQKNYNPGALIKALGLGPTCSADVFEKIVLPGEIYLSASDGLFDMVTDQRISAVIEENQDKVDDIPKILIDEAIKNGGKDNITVIACKVMKD